MLNPDHAWQTDGFYRWVQLLPEFLVHEAKQPGSATAHAFRRGFKAGVKTADICFFQKLAPEHTQN